MAGMMIARFGGLQIMWSYFDMLIEVIGMRELKLSVKQSHIVFSSLGHGAKVSIVKSLLRETDKHQPLVSAIGSVSKIAQRNHLIHSIVRGDDSQMIFIHRENRGTLNFKSLKFDDDAFEEKFVELQKAVETVEDLSGIKGSDIEDYTAFSA